MAKRVVSRVAKKSIVIPSTQRERFVLVFQLSGLTVTQLAREADLEYSSQISTFMTTGKNLGVDAVIALGDVMDFDLTWHYQGRLEGLKPPMRRLVKKKLQEGWTAPVPHGKKGRPRKTADQTIQDKEKPHPDTRRGSIVNLKSNK